MVSGREDLFGCVPETAQTAELTSVGSGVLVMHLFLWLVVMRCFIAYENWGPNYWHTIKENSCNHEDHRVG